MNGPSECLLGVGIYTIAESARLARVPASRIRRWVRGYSFRVRSGMHRSPPAVRGDLRPIGGSFALSFLDLIEVRFVDAFLKAGVRWPTMRNAHAEARRLIGNDHPFCTNTFCTDGRRVFADMPRLRDEPGLVEVLAKQHYFESIVRPLLKGLEFAPGDQLLRWRPLGPRRQVVIDPARGFGAPIVDREGIPTSVLALALAGNSREDVIAWYQVGAASLDDAEEFERTLAA